MKFRFSLLRKALFAAFFTLLSIQINSQSLDGIYSDGEVSLHLEETEDGFKGLFLDSDGTYYEAFFFADEDGLFGMLDELGAFIPWDSENMLLYLMPLDANEEPILEQAVELELQYVSGLQNEASYIDYSALSWSPVSRIGSDFYPSYVLATSTWSKDVNFGSEESSYKFYGDQNGYFGFSLENFPIGSIVHVEIEGEPLARLSSYNTTITQEGINEIFPIIEYDYQALKNMIQAGPVNFKYRVFVNNEFVGEKMETIWARSVNDAVTVFMDHHGREMSFEHIFAAYVNENDPGLDPILGKALDYGIINSWVGKLGTEIDIYHQIFTLWYHFQKQGFKYSTISQQSGTDARSGGQTVRFVSDALKTTQANCIDGTVLFASFLYKIGLDVSIVLVPGHAYLAVDLDKEGNKVLALETTLMGETNLGATNEQASAYAAQQGWSPDVQKSWNTFYVATSAGSKDYMTNALPNIQQGNDPRYMEIDIGEARRGKIRPIK